MNSRSKIYVLMGVVLVLSALIFRITHQKLYYAHNLLNKIPTKQDSGSINAQIATANSLLLQNHSSQAMEAYATIAHEDPANPASYIGLAVIAIKQKKDQIAKANLVQAIKCNPNNPLVWHLSGDIDSRDGYFLIAVKEYQKTVILDPKDEVAWRQIGVLDTNHLMYAQGLTALQTAVQLNPHDLLAQKDLGICAAIQGQLSLAQQAYQTVLEANANDAEALAGLAGVMLELNPTPNGLSSAMKLCIHSQQVSPSFANTTIMGHILLLQRKYVEAIKMFNISLKEYPDQKSVYIWLSEAYASSGQPKKAQLAADGYQKLKQTLEKKRSYVKYLGMGHG